MIPRTLATVSWVRVGFWVLAMIFISPSSPLGMAMVAWVVL